MSDLVPILRQAEKLVGSNQLEEARAVLQRAVAKHADQPDLNSAMCFVLLRLGHTEQAVYFAKRAIAAMPDQPSFLSNIGNMLALAGRSDDAAAIFERVVKLAPDDPKSWLNLGAAYFQGGHVLESEKACRRGLEIHPDQPRLIDACAGAIRKLGRMREAYDFVREGVKRNPDSIPLAQELAFNSNYPSGLSAAEIFEAHQSYGHLLAKRVERMTLEMPTTKDRDRKLRIGFLSPDFRSHSVSFYAEPLITSLDHARFDVLLYHTHHVADVTTARFKSLADGWCDAALLADEPLASRIAADRVDVLIELSGLTAGARPGVLARKPAPVMVTYLGYPNTTGIRTIDARMVDSITDPSPKADALAVEKLIRIDPCFLCYKPSPDAPEVGPAPHLTHGYVTFGSFNAGMKFSDQCLAMWARVLNTTPNSRLLLKNFDLSIAEVRAHVAERLALHGVDGSRVEMLAYTPTAADHLKLYDRVDVGLDTYPYHGTTTTCEAFHQGIPVITLEGPIHASRVGCTLLRAVGLPELIAKDEDDFVRIASELASDSARMVKVRGEMRSRQARSPLGDASSFGKRFGDALITLWHQACDDSIQMEQK